MYLYANSHKAKLDRPSQILELNSNIYTILNYLTLYVNKNIGRFMCIWVAVTILNVTNKI